MNARISSLAHMASSGQTTRLAAVELRGGAGRTQSLEIGPRTFLLKLHFRNSSTYPLDPSPSLYCPDTSNWSRSLHPAGARSASFPLHHSCTSSNTPPRPCDCWLIFPSGEQPQGAYTSAPSNTYYPHPWSSSARTPETTQGTDRKRKA